MVSSFGILCVILCLEVGGLDPNWALQVWKLSLQKKDTLGLVMLNHFNAFRISQPIEIREAVNAPVGQDCARNLHLGFRKGRASRAPKLATRKSEIIK